ncbi:ATP-dependent DNA helicase PIF1-like protein [Tanacetum coccineum]
MKEQAYNKEQRERLRPHEINDKNNLIDLMKESELLSPTTDPIGYTAVSDYKLHGPCGKDNRAAACNIEGKCSKHFPKPFYAETVIDQDGYPIYRRRDDKVSVKKGNFTFDNKHVVPHNLLSLRQIQAHINIEWCNRSKAIKYYFKYLNKGPDRATIIIQENVQQGQVRAQAFDMNKSRIQHQELYPQLNPEQRLIYEEVVDSVHNKKGQFHFVYGPGGTGKTFLYKTIISRLRPELKIVLAVASSGIASLLLPGGRTAHSRIDKTLRDILGYPVPDKRNKIFGGMTVLLGGDFRQILPVIPKGKRADIVQACINRSELWKHCKVLAVGDGKVLVLKLIGWGKDKPTLI